MGAMAQDPYQTLGVKKGATQDEIRAAFRKLAKKHHPDLNPGNAEAEARFKAASAANELLSDPERRAQYDRGEIDGEGQPTERQFYRQYAEGQGGARYRRQGAAGGADPFSDIFAEMFRQGGGPAGGNGPGHNAGFNAAMRGQDRQFALTIPFLEAAAGGTRRITLPEGRTLDVTIPPGMEDGRTLRLRGQGEAGWNGGPPGDALIEISVTPHPFLRREGRDLHLDLHVTAAEAVLGAKIPVPTLSGTVTLTIPAHSDHGRRLRLRGRGIPAHGGQEAGDLYAVLTIVTGPPDAELEEALRAWSGRHPHVHPRATLMASMAAEPVS